MPLDVELRPIVPPPQTPH